MSVMVDEVIDMNDVKPCPWCGSEPVVIPDDSYDSCIVACANDDACLMAPSLLLDVGELEEAIRIWNDRAGPSEA